jgi:MFS family permease
MLDLIIMNRSLRTLFLFNGIFVFSASLLGPLYALYVEGLDQGVLSVSTTWAVFTMSATFFMFLLTKFGDRVKDKENLLLAGFIIRAIVWFSYTLIGNISSLILLQILLGLGEALGTPAYDSLLAEHLDRGKHISECARWKLISNLVGSIATIIGGFTVTIFGFNPLFRLMSILALISFIGILKSPKRLL